ncbi:MAG: hypothetical protein CVT93_10560 [Bacteroidetes bacterium HGW-Bacteroidetes-10]|nr:MAG: hypothetical protein CVT93_10560 [Bacteroidetes bacterium HGW-Bacteroidetes-10]
MIDLLGFSSHLEISSYDLRTSIGKQALNRLDNLENLMNSLKLENENFPDYYPENFSFQRINDAIFITMDLDDILIPSIGKTISEGLSVEDVSKYFTEEQLSETGFRSNYTSRMLDTIQPLLKFVGFISRLHISLNKLEEKSNFPGAKTVVSTGFRRRFVSKVNLSEDYFSANFAMANTYIAERSLHGPNLYLDNGILQLISFNKYGKNILRFSHFHFKEREFNCFEDCDDVFSISSEPCIPNLIEINLFRKTYHYRNLNPSPLTYLQSLSSIIPFLEEKVLPDLSNIYYKHIFHAIKFGVSEKRVKDLKLNPSFIFNQTYDLDVEIGIFHEYISTGKSKTKEEKKEREFENKYADCPAEAKQEIKEFLDQECDIKLTPIRLENFGDFIYSLSEEMFSTLLLIIEGDLDQLDYKKTE